TPAIWRFPAFLALRTNVLSSLSTSLTAACVVAIQVLPRNGSLIRTTGPAWRMRAKVGNGSRKNDCEVRSMLRTSSAIPKAPADGDCVHSLQITQGPKAVASIGGNGLVAMVHSGRNHNW